MTVRSYYTGVLAKFTECARNSSINVNGAGSSFEAVSANGKKVGSRFELHEPLSLKVDLPAGSSRAKDLGTASGQLELLVLPREHYIAAHNFEMVKSVVEVAYVLNKDGEPSRLLLGCHFDFQCEASGNPKTCHPLFHAEVTSKLIELREHLEKKGIAAAQRPKFPPMRLPTAHLSFAGTLVTLAADNFIPDQFKAFLDDVRGRTPFPCMVNAKFKSRMDADSWKMRSCVWYP